MLPAGYANGRTATQAVAYALTQVGQWRDSGYCLRFVGRVVYQRPYDGASINEAHMVWDNAPASMRYARDFDAPRGAIVLWNASIGGGAGHIAISLGGGKMVTTTGGAISIRNIARLLRPRLPRLDAPVLQEPAMSGRGGRRPGPPNWGKTPQVDVSDAYQPIRPAVSAGLEAVLDVARHRLESGHHRE